MSTKTKNEATEEIMTLDEMTALGVKRGRPSVVDPKIIDALSGLNVGQARKFDNVFGKAADKTEQGKIRTKIRKHYPLVYVGEEPTIRWTSDGVPMVGRSGKKAEVTA